MSTFRTVAAALAANGYLPVPIEPHGKRPMLSGWPDYIFTSGEELLYGEAGAGILTGEVRPIDIDVMRADIAAKIRAQAEATWGKMPARIGQAPKLALLCRTLTPGHKLQSIRYRLPDDLPDAKPHCVEVLGQGQQLVCFGKHAVTGRDYTWNGAGSLLDVPLEQLPVVTEAELLGFLKWCNALLEEAGGVAVGTLTRNAEASVPSAHGLPASNIAECLDAIKHLPAGMADAFDDWCRVGLAIKGALGDTLQADTAWHEFSALSAKYDSVAADCQWDTFHPSSLGAGSLYKWAQDNGWQRPAPPPVDIAGLLAPKARESEPSDAPVPVQSAPAVHVPIDWADVGHNPPPPRRWAIDGWLGVGHVTLLAGRGGVGKTLLMQQLASSLALGRDFLATVPDPRPTLMWCAEDDADELKRRQIAIAEWLGVPIGTFAQRLIVLPLAGIDCSLCELQGGQLRMTKMASTLVEQVRDYKAGALCLDNIAHLFGGDENNRHQVTLFANYLTGLALQADIAIALAGHPAKSLESEFSGSTAWENAVRGRLYLSRTPPDQDDSTADPAGLTRYISKRKANYSALDCRRLAYSNGVLRPEDVGPADDFLDGIRAKSACEVVLRGVETLKKSGTYGLPASNQPTFLPKQLISFELSEGLHKSELEKAMRQLMKDGRLVMGVVGKYANRTDRLGLVVA